jgi:uncharacterized protein
MWIAIPLDVATAEVKLSAADALDLLDWKRQVFGLYESVRASDDSRAAWEHWRVTRDRLFRDHPQSPLPADERGEFTGCDYFDYDPRARVLARIESTQPVRSDVAASTGAAFPFSKVATLWFTLYDHEHSLALLWNEGYGGGLFVSFQDETSGQETYPAARYLLDTVKGADLGTNSGEVFLDFNFAYNPSCAYDDSWACPLATPESRLRVRVCAGERAPS